MVRTCNQAKKDGLQYAWIDTCCIDKSSSAELQEAINSMFLWYAESSQCYALLEDFETDNDRPEPKAQHELTESRWFTRGWTLQELIAPSQLTFFDCNWSPQGRREEFVEGLVKRTRVDAQILCRPKTPHFDSYFRSSDNEDIKAHRPTRTRAITTILSRFSAAQRIS